MHSPLLDTRNFDKETSLTSSWDSFYMFGIFCLLNIINIPWQHTPNPDAHDPRSVPPLNDENCFKNIDE